MWYKLLLASFGCLVLSCLTGTPSVRASQTTGNKFVTGVVEDGSGWIWWLKGNSPKVPPSVQLSYQNKSFLSVKVGTKVYSNTNADILAGVGHPDVYLDNGTNTKIEDTIETVWPEDGFDIVQDVYPVEFEISGQIVYKVKIINHSGSSLPAQAQFLLDVDVYQSDNAAILTRYNYTPNWTLYPNSNHGVPWFFLGFQNPPTSFNPGTISTGYVTDDLTPVPLGLTTPDIFAVVDWFSESNYAWGLQPSPPWGSAYRDNGIFTQYKATFVPGSKDTIQEIARGSYGTGEFELCQGNLVAITFYPHRLKYDGKNRHYVPNPFNVEAMIFNVSSTADATKARASLTISALTPPGPIRVTSPSGATTLSDGRIQQVQDIGTGIIPGVGGTIPKLDVAEVHWLDSTLDVINCNGDSATSLSLNVTYAGLPPPAFATPCDMPIIIECTVTDTVPPRFAQKKVNVFTDSITVVDNAQVDKGIKRISWVASPPSNATVSVTWPPANFTQPNATFADLGCSMDQAVVHVHQKDSTIAVCVDFTFIDCNNNSSFTRICYPAHPVPGHPDSLPPEFVLRDRFQRNPNPDTNCNSARSNWSVTEIRTHDAGLLSVDVLPGSAKNMTFHASGAVNPGDRNADFNISVDDPMQDGSIIIVATDSIVPHHVAYDTIYYCTYHDVLNPYVTASPAPVNEMWHVHATDSQAWDRKLDTVFFTGLVNCSVKTPLPAGWNGTAGAGTFTAVANPPLPIGDFDVVRTDTLVKSCFVAFARDSAGNWSDTVSRCSDVVPDALCPTIIYDTISKNPLKVKVTITDDHQGNAYDVGIQTISFSAPHNLMIELPNGSKSTTFSTINEPYTAGNHPPYPISDWFYLSLTDPNTSDPAPATITIYAVDGAGNKLLCPVGSATWQYPVTPDFNAPTIQGAPPTHTSLSINIADNRASDRGIGEIKLKNVVNFAPPFFVQPYDSVFNKGNAKQYTLSLNVITKGKSSYADIWTIDTFGVLTGNPVGHSDSTSVWIYAQDMRMASALVTSGSPPIFNLPVYLKWTDSIPLAQKKIKQYQFTFDLTPPNPLISFNGVNTVGTLSAGWTVTPTIPAPASGPYMVTGISAGAALPTLTSTQMDAQPLLYLQFKGSSSSSPAQTNLTVSGTPGEEVTYNGGTPSTFNTTPDATVTLPAPFGTISGGTIVFQGYCSPIIGPNLKPNAISLAPTTPNPTKSNAIVIYTIPEESQVTLELFNVLGERVRSVVSEVQKQGEYKLDLAAGDLPEGTYFLRLSSGGKVVSRQVVIGR